MTCRLRDEKSALKGCARMSPKKVATTEPAPYVRQDPIVQICISLLSAMLWMIGGDRLIVMA